VSLILVGLAVSLPATWGMLRLGRRLGALDSGGVAGQVKAPARAVPNTGGVGIFLGIALPVLAGLGLAHAVDVERVASAMPALAGHLPGIREQTPLALLFLGCLAVLHVMGLVDDRRPLGAMPKLAVMVAVAAAIPLLSKDTRLLEVLDGPAGGPWLSVLLTVGWIVVVTNAMNFLDNMDGLAGGIAAMAGGCFLIGALLSGQWFVAASLALLVGACVGFLVFNFPPAKIFMGDSGSLVLGFTLAFLTVRTTYYSDAEGHALAGGWYAVLMPVVVLAVPLYDFVSVVLIRLRQGRSPFVGDLQHFSHRLVRIGLSRRAAVVVIYGFTAATGIGGIALASLEPWQALLVGVQTGVILGVLGALEYAAVRQRRREGGGP
jgi:UDP-GlcNAc:undecaprenyl-phosphate/decaprenyl-phosphate GlcNAc-1-phosphate transferase